MSVLSVHSKAFLCSPLQVYSCGKGLQDDRACEQVMDDLVDLFYYRMAAWQQHSPSPFVSLALALTCARVFCKISSLAIATMGFQTTDQPL